MRSELCSRMPLFSLRVPSGPLLIQIQRTLLVQDSDDLVNLGVVAVNDNHGGTADHSLDIGMRVGS